MDKNVDTNILLYVNIIENLPLHIQFFFFNKLFKIFLPTICIHVLLIFHGLMTAKATNRTMDYMLPNGTVDLPRKLRVFLGEWEGRVTSKAA